VYRNKLDAVIVGNGEVSINNEQADKGLSGVVAGASSCMGIGASYCPLLATDYPILHLATVVQCDWLLRDTAVCLVSVGLVRPDVGGTDRRRYCLAGATDRPEFITPSSVRLLLVAFFAFSMPAWVEENLFRGYLQPLLAKQVGLWTAITIQALFFSVAHLGWSTKPLDFGSTFVAGLILGWLRGREHSLVGPFLAHGLVWLLAAFGPPPV